MKQDFLLFGKSVDLEGKPLKDYIYRKKTVCVLFSIYNARYSEIHNIFKLKFNALIDNWDALYDDHHKYCLIYDPLTLASISLNWLTIFWQPICGVFEVSSIPLSLWDDSIFGWNPSPLISWEIFQYLSCNFEFI